MVLCQLKKKKEVGNWIKRSAQCLKITEKVSFIIESSYVYILSDKSSSKMPKMVHFDEFLKTWSLWSYIPDRSMFMGWKKDTKGFKQRFEFDTIFMTIWTIKLLHPFASCLTFVSFLSVYCAIFLFCHQAFAFILLCKVVFGLVCQGFWSNIL